MYCSLHTCTGSYTFAYRRRRASVNGTRRRSTTPGARGEQNRREQRTPNAAGALLGSAEREGSVLLQSVVEARRADALLGARDG